MFVFLTAATSNKVKQMLGSIYTRQSHVLFSSSCNSFSVRARQLHHTLALFKSKWTLWASSRNRDGAERSRNQMICCVSLASLHCFMNSLVLVFYWWNSDTGSFLKSVMTVTVICWWNIFTFLNESPPPPIPRPAEEFHNWFCGVFVCLWAELCWLAAFELNVDTTVHFIYFFYLLFTPGSSKSVVLTLEAVFKWNFY